MSRRLGTLLVPVSGLSGTTYPEGTRVAIRGSGGSVDGFVDGDWLPLAWWEFADTQPEGGPGTLA
ncbi:hypothetical protein [Streptomyces caelestis]|uniref:Uncharacterized protein n=1 Tax=Streptomyces caelestis TaxID=36816 RepID=A0A7W9LTU8_9ACTN|nr:hypothetical protein [Streptomyces caelestis]MBB5795985.1 hypothetical protein [Streptomyces caelestis]GGW44299.1 hypothetical protein GCM10010320_25840 [Streptomyces caelestis]